MLSLGAALGYVGRDLQGCDPQQAGMGAAASSFIAWALTPSGAEQCLDGLFIGGPIPSPANILMYLALLLWSFVGVAIGADVFMVSIERITSQETVILRKVNGVHKEFTVLVWNGTVANLTLMALGSSAPEILLSCIEIVTSGFYAGELGPSTIVGSAAFNLLVISAVCVLAIPNGEGRYIKDRGVFYITATFSVAAYVWLIVILQMISPNIVEVWEGAVTFMLFPVLVWLAYIADQGCFDCNGKPPDAGGKVIAVSKDGRNIGLDDCLSAYESGLSAEEQAERIEQMLGRPKTRAFYRVQATRSGTGGQVPAGKDGDTSTAVFQFRHPLLTLKPGQRWVDVYVDRVGNKELACSVAYRSVGQSSAGEARSEGTIDFATGQTESFIRMSVLESESAFYVVLVDPSPGADCGNQWNCAVLMEQEASPGMLKFEHEQMTIKESQGVLWVTVRRVGGATGKITFQLKTKDVTAFEGADYVGLDQEVFMASGQLEHTFPIHIHDDEQYENDETFQIILSDAKGGVTFDPTTDGGSDKAVATVTIISDEAVRRKVDELAALINVNTDMITLSADSWGQQFKDAVEYEGDVSVVGGLMYGLALPWKVMFACTPPPRIAGGWLSFVIALVFIGLLTALIGDLAAHMGCCMGLTPGITAITFVALGTSLPDTFASKTAAQQEPYADSSIGNITGSNSVNVFLGLGLPWMIAALYWSYFASSDSQAAWHARYGAESWYTPGMPIGFVVAAADLGFSVMIFTATALVCLAVLLLRRSVTGYELGGNQVIAMASALLFIFLWFIYIGMSVLHTYGVV